LQKGIEGPAFEVGLNRRWSDAGLLKEIEVHKEANGGDVVGKTIEPALIAVGIDRPLGEIGEVVLVALDVRVEVQQQLVREEEGQPGILNDEHVGRRVAGNQRLQLVEIGLAAGAGCVLLDGELWVPGAEAVEGTT